MERLSKSVGTGRRIELLRNESIREERNPELITDIYAELRSRYPGDRVDIPTNRDLEQKLKLDSVGTLCDIFNVDVETLLSMLSMDRNYLKCKLPGKIDVLRLTLHLDKRSDEARKSRYEIFIFLSMTLGEDNRGKCEVVINGPYDYRDFNGEKYFIIFEHRPREIISTDGLSSGKIEAEGCAGGPAAFLFRKRGRKDYANFYQLKDEDLKGHKISYRNNFRCGDGTPDTYKPPADRPFEVDSDTNRRLVKNIRRVVRTCGDVENIKTSIVGVIKEDGRFNICRMDARGMSSTR